MTGSESGKPKALALLSGGLDSMLAIAILRDQGIPVHALTCVSLFTASRSSDGTKLQSMAAAEQLGVPLTIINWSREFLELVKAPVYGHGSNMNPCIDCRLAVLRMAAERMEGLGCRYVVTGEVLGERPMSQRRQPMEMVQSRSGLGERLLRPLSAQLLPSTLPEQRGWVDRERLHAIRGRSRKPQMELAKAFGILDYPSPAGGCLLTDPAFSVRLRDLLTHDPDCDLNDAHLLKVGRHFRFGPEVRLVVGRDHYENRVVRSYVRHGDVLLQAKSFTGPVALLRGPATEEHLRQAGAATLRYGKARRTLSAAVSWHRADGESGEICVAPASEDALRAYRLAGPSGPRKSE
jgi:hypothetical protein